MAIISESAPPRLPSCFIPTSTPVGGSREPPPGRKSISAAIHGRWGASIRRLQDQGIPLDAALKAAWALVLQCYVPLDVVSFEYRNLDQCSNGVGPHGFQCHKGSNGQRNSINGMANGTPTIRHHARNGGGHAYGHGHDDTDSSMTPSDSSDDDVYGHGPHGRTLRPSNSQLCLMRVESADDILDLMKRINGAHEGSVPSFPSSKSVLLLSPVPAAQTWNTELIFRGHNGSGEDLSPMFVPLTVAVTKTPQDRLRTEASYDSNLIDEGLATSMLESFGSILADILCDPQGPVSSTEACSLRDRHLIHDHTRDMEPGHCELVHDVIGQFFRTTPGRMAICSASEGDMTYGELDDLSSRLAHYLVSLGGVGPEQYVFSCFHKSTWANVARLAIMRSGSAYVSINAKSPPAYLSDVVKRTRARIMLTMPEFEGEFSGYVQHTVPLSRAFLEALPRHESPPVTDVRPDNACLVLFTSGSTGEPKGIVQTHQAYATSIADYARRLRLGPHTRFFQADDYHYDISNIEFFAPLSVGGSCIVPQSHVVHNIPDMVANIRALKPNIAFFTPTMLVRLTDTDALSSLDIICVGGELVPSDVVARWNSKHKTTRLVNQYGMGEVAVACTLNQTLRSEESMNVGQSASGAIWIADPACPERLMPVGAVGEIIIEGRHLSRHYLPPLSEATARPATEAIFLDGAPGWLHELHQDRALAIQSPHSGPDIPTRLYRSGDLGRLLHDGSIQHLGRKDTMLKLDGCRVEALDVEHNARTCLDSTDAIVVDVVGEVGGRRWPILVAYLYLENKGTAVMTGSSPKKPLPSISDAEADPVGAVKVDEIKNALARVLDPSMIPLRWFLLSSLPRTPSGKTDRKTLHVMGQKTYMQEVF